MTVRPVEAGWLSAAICAWLLLVDLSCLLPMPAAGPDLPHGDKLGHIGLFFIAGLILGWRAVVPASAAALLLVAHGALLELLQATSGFRQAEWADLAADAVGALLGLLLARRLPAGGAT